MSCQRRNKNCLYKEQNTAAYELFYHLVILSILVASSNFPGGMGGWGGGLTYDNVMNLDHCLTFTVYYMSAF